MSKNEILKLVVQTVITVLTALCTALGVSAAIAA